jgi:hypothetical protein
MMPLPLTPRFVRSPRAFTPAGGNLRPTAGSVHFFADDAASVLAQTATRAGGKPVEAP